MDVAAELLGLGVALLLLGVAAGLCVRCSSLGGRRSEKILEQNSLNYSWQCSGDTMGCQGSNPGRLHARPNDQPSFMVSRTYTLATQACPGSLRHSNPAVDSARKDKLLLFSQAPEDSASCRYQNFSKGSRLGSDTDYIDPIPANCYNWGHLQKPPGEDDDDAASYENVLICRQNPDSGDESSEDYQNSVSIQRWHQSREHLEMAWREDEDKDEDPDYVNGDVVPTEA